MTQLDAFLQAVKDDPDDDAPRLLLADWLEEQGDPRGEFLRVQCLRSRLPLSAPQWDHLDQREAELLCRHGSAWLGPWKAAKRWQFHRGLLYVGMRAADFWAGPCAMEEAFAWVESLQLWDLQPSTSHQLAAASFPSRLTGLILSKTDLGPMGATQIAQSPHLAGLTALDLSYTGLTNMGVTALTALSHWKRLTRLSLEHDDVTEVGAAVLARWPALASVRALHLGSNRIGGEGAMALASSPYLEKLEFLDLAYNRVDARGATALAASEHLPRLRRLGWVGNPVGDAANAALRRRYREAHGWHG